MPNGTVNDSVKFLFVFRERHFGLGFLGPHWEVPIPKYDLDVISQNKFILIVGRIFLCIERYEYH